METHERPVDRMQIEIERLPVDGVWCWIVRGYVMIHGDKVVIYQQPAETLGEVIGFVCLAHLVGIDEIGYSGPFGTVADMKQHTPHSWRLPK